jgi:hypothetical protein
MKKIVVIVEIGMLGGIVVAALVLPKSTQLATFLMVSGAAIMLGNVLLFRQLKKRPSAEGARESRFKSGTYVSLIVMITMLVLLYLANKL